MPATTDPFERESAFERRGDEYALTTAEFEAAVEAVGDRYRVTVELPTLDAVATDGVGDAVVEGWYETLTRRLEDLSSAGMTRTDDVAAPTVERDGDTVTVVTTFESASPAEDARAVVTYVEGTWFEGIVPGYDYVASVQRTRERARQRGESDAGETTRR